MANPFDQFDAPKSNPFDQFDAPPKASGAIRRLVADKALGFASGAVGATKAIADAAGAGNAVSTAMEQANAGINDYLSPEAKADQQEQAAIMAGATGKGAWEGIKAGALAFGVAPVQTAMQGLGSVAPIVAGSALTGGALPAAAVGAGLGVAMGAGTAKGAIFDDIKKRSLAAGMTDADATAAATRAQEYGGENTDQIALGGALGAADALTGVSAVAGKLARGALGKPVAAGIAEGSRRGVVGRALTGMAGEMPLEAAQGGQEQLAANLAAQRAGFDAGTFDNVASNATLEALASAGPGAAFGVANRAPAQSEAPPATPALQIGNTPEPAPPAGPTPQLGYSPLAGTPTVFPDGSVALNGEQEFARRYAPQKPSEAMGLDPAAGPLSAAAVTAVDTGAHQEIQLQQASEADQAAYQQATAEQDRQAAEMDTATKPITHGPIAEAAMSPEDKRAVLFSNQTVADGGIQYKGTLDGDILNGLGKPYPNRLAAARRANMEGKDWTIAQVQDGFVARRKDANGPTNGVQPAGSGVVPAGRADSPASVAPGPVDGSGAGAKQSRPVAGVLGQSGELPKRTDAAPVAAGRAQPTTLSAQTTATAGPGFTAKDVTRVQNAAPGTNTTPAAQAGEAPAVMAGNAATSEGLPNAGSATVEGAGVDQTTSGTGQASQDKTPQGATQQAQVNPPSQAAPLKTVESARSQGTVRQSSGQSSSVDGTPSNRESQSDDQKRAKAIERIAKGSAYFSNGLKAQQFIAQNGLKDTHQAVKTSATRWDVKSKVSQPQEQTSAKAPKAIEATAQQQAAGPATNPAKPAASDGVAAASEAKPAAAPVAKPGLERIRAAREAKKTKPNALQQKVEQAAQARADYFTPGNIVESWAGHDRVVSYTAPDKPGGDWSVTVRAVEKKDGKWVDVPRERDRNHSTQPEPGKLKVGPVERASGLYAQSAGAAEVVLSGEEIAPLAATGKDLRTLVSNWTRARWGSGASFDNRNSKSTIEVVWQSLKHAISNANEPELRLLAGLPKMLESAAYIGQSADKAARPDIKAVHSYSTVALLNGERLDVGIVVRETKDGHRFYDHFILKNKNPSGISGAASSTKADGLGDQPAEGSAGSIAPAEPEVKGKPTAPRDTPSAKSDRIEDFGTKIGGAKKDTWTGFKDDLSAIKDDDIASHKLSETWPAPDYQRMIDDGMDARSVAMIRALRDEIPAKPRNTYKLKRWAEQVKLMRDMATLILNGKDTGAALSAQLERGSSQLQGIAGRVDLYLAVGHDKSLEGISLAHHHYSLYRGRENVSLWVAEREAGATAFSNWPQELATGDTKEDAIAAFKARYAELDGIAAVKKASFDIYTQDGKFFIGKKIGRNIAEMAGPFVTLKEAREYRTNNLAALDAKLAKYKEIPQERRDTNEPRVGEDMRNGQDVTPEMFAQSFGFKGVEFGNWVEQKRRQRDLNDAFDSLMDMAAIIGVPAKAISLNGELGLAFGARGSGGVNPAAAHYEPGKIVINLTKREGAGSLGHEWWHALDNYFSRMRDSKTSPFMTTAIDVGLSARRANYEAYPGVRKEMIDAFGEVVRSIKQTAIKARSSKIDAKRTKEYWTTGEEMAARAFESYLISKLQDQNASNDYLANVVDQKTWDAMAALGMENDDSYPYPTAGEMPVIRAGFDKFFQTLETKETDQGVAMFSRGEQASTGLTTEQFTAELTKAFGPKVAERLQAQGIVVPVADKSKIPGSVSPFLRDGDKVYGFYDPSTNRTYAVLENLTPDMVKGVVLHEVGVHFGFEGLLGIEKYAQVMKRVNVMRLAGNKAVLAAYAEAKQNAAHASQVGEETIAYLVQRNQDMGLVREIIARIKAFLYEKFGIGGDSLTEADLTMLARAAVLHATRTGEGKGLAPAFVRGTTEPVTKSNDVVGNQGGRSADDTTPGVLKDESGNPLVVYHGSPQTFDKFEAKHISSGMYGEGFYFTNLRDDAELYAEGGRVIKANLVMKNPASRAVAEEVANRVGEDDYTAIRKELQNMGYDGVIAKGTAGGEVIYVVFKPEQITQNESTAPDSGGAPVAQTDTPAFKAWFGDSKVVDADGKPLVVYHGTNKTEQGDAFTMFDSYGSNYGLFGQGAYFTENPAVASSYTSKGRGDAPSVYPAFLSIKNPMDMDKPIRQKELDAWRKAFPDVDFGNTSYEPPMGKRPNGLNNEDFYRIVEEHLTDEQVERYEGAQIMQEGLRSMGHDGITHVGGGRVKSEGVRHQVYIAFDPEQVKSATGNNGQFDASNPDIRFSRSIGDTLNTAANNATVNKVVDKLNEHFTHPGKVSWWDKTVGSPYHLAERSHAFKRVFEAVQRFINDVSFYANEAADLAPKLLPKLDTWRDLGKQPISAADNTAIAAPIYEGTLSWTRDEAGKPVRVADDETAGIVFTDAELKSLFNLTPEQIGLYHQFRDATDKSLDNMAKAEMLRYGGKDVVGLRDMVMDAQDANDAAVLLRDHLIELAKDDEARAGALTETAHGMIERSDKVDKLKKKGYAPLSRFGRYSVDVVVAGKREYFGLFETVHDSNKMAAKMKMMHGAANVAQGTMSQKQFQLFQGITPESLELFGNMLGLESDGDKASDKAFQDYLRLTKNNRSAMKRLIHRKGIAGYSEDVGRTLAAFVYSNARQTAAGLHMGEMGEAVNDIPKVEGELKDAAIELTEYVKNPREEAQALRGLMFAQYLGGSVASAFVNFTQPMTVSFPYLSQFGGAGKAGAALIQAMKDQRAGKVLEPGLARALKIADETGTTQPQAVHELMAQSRGAATLKAGDGTRMGDASALVGNSVAKVALGWGKLFGLAEQINRRSTFIAAYRIAVEQKITDPAGFATKAVNETQFINNKGNKAKFGRGAIGATLMAFKSYSINYLELLHRMATRNGPEGKKAAALMLGMLFLMAGAGGMPGADDLDDVIDLFAQRLGYNFSSQKAKQEFLEGLFGKAGAQFIERGITGLPGAPIDVSGRMSMGNLIPGTGLLLKKSDHTRDVTEVAGAFGDMAIRAFKAGDQLLSGDLGKAILTASPKAASNFAQGVDMASSGMYKDAKGYKVIDTTPTEAAMKAIGFQPASVSKVQEANYLNQRAKDFYSLHAADIRSRWAKGIFEDDKDQVQAARDMMKTWNDNNPDQRIMPNMVAIMRKVHEMRKTKEQRIADTAPKAMRATLRQQIAERAAQ